MIGYDHLHATDAYEKLFCDAVLNSSLPYANHDQSESRLPYANHDKTIDQSQSNDETSNIDKCKSNDASSEQCKTNRDTVKDVDQSKTNEDSSAEDDNLTKEDDQDNFNSRNATIDPLTNPDDSLSVLASVGLPLQKGVEQFLDIHRRILIKQETPLSPFASTPSSDPREEKGSGFFVDEQVGDLSRLSGFGEEPLDDDDSACPTSFVSQTDADGLTLSGMKTEDSENDRSTFNDASTASFNEDAIADLSIDWNSPSTTSSRPRRERAFRRRQVYDDFVEDDDDVDFKPGRTASSGDGCDSSFVEASGRTSSLPSKRTKPSGNVKKRRVASVSAQTDAAFAEGDADAAASVGKAAASVGKAAASVGDAAGKTASTASPKSKAKLPCICEFCGRSFKAKLNLRIHVKNVHARIRKFKCDQCPKDFITGYLLLEHTQADHEGLPSHLCPICGKGESGGVVDVVPTV